jgi:hypothetical protein
MRSKRRWSPSSATREGEIWLTSRLRRAGPDRLIPPAMQHGKQPFWAGLQLLARLTLNTRNYAANQPARLAQLDDGNGRAILVQGDEGPAQVVRLGIAALHRENAATKLHSSPPAPQRLSVPGDRGYRASFYHDGSLRHLAVGMNLPRGTLKSNGAYRSSSSKKRMSRSLDT